MIPKKKRRYMKPHIKWILRRDSTTSITETITRDTYVYMYKVFPIHENSF